MFICPATVGNYEKLGYTLFYEGNLVAIKYNHDILCVKWWWESIGERAMLWGVVYQQAREQVEC